MYLMYLLPALGNCSSLVASALPRRDLHAPSKVGTNEALPPRTLYLTFTLELPSSTAYCSTRRNLLSISPAYLQDPLAPSYYAWQRLGGSVNPKTCPECLPINHLFLPLNLFVLCGCRPHCALSTNATTYGERHGLLCLVGMD